MPKQLCIHPTRSIAWRFISGLVLFLGLTASSNGILRTHALQNPPTRFSMSLGHSHKTIRLAAGDDGPFLSFADLLKRPIPSWERLLSPTIKPPPSMVYPDALKAVPIAPRTYSEETVNYLARHEIVHGDRQKPLVALTFDCESGTNSTRQILQTLRENQVHTTFFILGKYAYMYPDLIREMVADGHELGNHSFFHPLFYDITTITATLEITFTEAAIDWAVGTHVPMRYFRLPYGGRSSFWIQFIAEWGYQSAFWGPDPKGWEAWKTPEDVIAYFQNTARSGDIFIMHCSAWNDVRALDQIICNLREKGLEPVTLTEMLTAADRNIPGYTMPGAQ